MSDKERLKEMTEYYPEGAAEYSDDIPWVIKYAKEQAERVQELEGAIKGADVIANIASDIIIELREGNSRLREALEFYANVETYLVNVTDQWEPVTKIDRDVGNIARQALKGGQHD